MLLKVVALSREEDQFVEKTDGPNGFPAPTKPGRCGMDPARSRESKADVLLFGVEDPLPVSMPVNGCGWNGLVEGAGLEVCESSDWETFTPLTVPTGENLEGTVPALARRPGPLTVVSLGGTRSGKPSWDGDSGIFSRRGVEFPLVGGPQMPGERPSCA